MADPPPPHRPLAGKLPRPRLQPWGSPRQPSWVRRAAVATRIPGPLRSAVAPGAQANTSGSLLTLLSSRPAGPTQLLITPHCCRPRLRMVPAAPWAPHVHSWSLTLESPQSGLNEPIPKCKGHRFPASHGGHRVPPPSVLLTTPPARAAPPTLTPALCLAPARALRPTWGLCPGLCRCLE